MFVCLRFTTVYCTVDRTSQMFNIIIIIMTTTTTIIITIIVLRIVIRIIKTRVLRILTTIKCLKNHTLANSKINDSEILMRSCIANYPFNDD